MLLTLPLVPVFMWLIGRYTAERTRERWLALRLLSTHFLDVVRGLPTLRAFNRSRAQATTIARGRRAATAARRWARCASRSSPGSVLELAATLGVALVAVTVGVRLVDGGLGLQAGLTVLMLAPELYLPFRQLGTQFHASADGLAVAERMLDAARGARGGRRRRAARPAEPGARCAVRLEGVSFAYPVAARTSCSTRSTSSSCPARPSRSSGASGPARARSRACSCGSPSRPRAGSRSAASTSRTCRTDAWRRLVGLGAAASDDLPRHGRATTSASARRARPTSAYARGGHARRRRPVRARAALGLRDGGRRRRPAALGRRAAADRARARVPARRAASSSSTSRPPTSTRSSADVVAEAVERLRPGRTVLLIAHRAELVRQADRVVVARRRRHAASSRRARRHERRSAACSRSRPFRGARARAVGRCSAP